MEVFDNAVGWASWRSGDAADCKSAYPGSIPGDASIDCWMKDPGRRNMIDYTAAREQMVDCQVRTNDVTEHELISALLSSPRERFVPDDLEPLAYSDSELPLAELGAEGRYIMPVARLANLIESAEIDNQDIVLIVGAGSGYSASILSQLAASVVAIEDNQQLVDFATERLSENGFDNVAVLQSPLNEGCAKEAPYDVILVEGAVEQLPQALLEQLTMGGKLIAVHGTGNSADVRLTSKHDNGFSSRSLMNCSVRPLPGFEEVKEFEL